MALANKLTLRNIVVGHQGVQVGGDDELGAALPRDQVDVLELREHFARGLRVRKEVELHVDPEVAFAVERPAHDVDAVDLRVQLRVEAHREGNVGQGAQADQVEVALFSPVD